MDYLNQNPNTTGEPGGLPPAANGYSQPPAWQAAPAYTPPPTPQAPPKSRRGRATNVLLGMLAVVLAAVLLFTGVAILSLGRAVSSFITPVSYNNNPPQNTFSVIYIVGTIAGTGTDPAGIDDPSYNHASTLSYIKQMTENENNRGLLLYMDTPGGGVMESDEVYLALMDYKEKTGRPVWAYMHGTCASGGYYICAAADHVVANRNTMTGSIGVYIALTDTSELYGKLGIETVLVRSGENKGTGMSGVPITEGQRAVYQGMVDEYYNNFLDVVVEGRNMDEDELRPLADGRVYTGPQALQLGLLDEIGNWDGTLEAFGEHTGAAAFHTSFSTRSMLGRTINKLFGALPTGDAEAMLNAAERYPTGVPMMLYDPDNAYG